MRAWLAALFLAGAAVAAHAQEKPLPSCSGLIDALKRDPSSIVNGSPLLSVEKLVANIGSSAENRVCTGVANYRDATTHITYTAKWVDDTKSTVDVNAHPTTEDETKARAIALRVAHHAEGTDGTFALVDYTPYCTDPDFLTMATSELHHGISTVTDFYLEPDYRISDIVPNGPGSGIMANCVATVSDDKVTGEIFFGTNWVNVAAASRFQFYVLETGPDGFKLVNRLWDLATE
jgi:hypothetical protein